MEEKIQSVQYRDSEPSEFAHKPPKQEMDLSCLSEPISAIRVPLHDTAQPLLQSLQCIKALLILQVGATA